ncbi:MAG TPA: glucose-1-phosphate thymidylyltransferase RfbA [Nitrospinota bacterium]|mgnify:CR=1 FL=1|jgi:glucose-1-phosphate thymidylyltransferase|nr:glucose-1-phosphate thymidylyltransferase RfbA [Nitrospinota bacterium]|tara:strand:+ start:38399 stop:39277 length:879 start_codon:yes stop_codon:yes gene_type:complete
MRKGIILGGGSGTRLKPLTDVTSKQLLPVYDKPMIYYPLSTLMLAGIQDILLISTPHDLPSFKKVLGDGAKFGISIKYKNQPRPLGLAHAFVIAKKFIGKDPVCMILGDNIFHGQGIVEGMQIAAASEVGATIFGYKVKNPEMYGVVSFDKHGKVKSIEEKPSNPKSNWAVTGLYFYDNNVVDIATNIKPSIRGELEITDVNRAYLDKGLLTVELLGRGVAWLDAGSPETLIQSANYIETFENRQGLKISCPEEIAWRMGYINANQLERLGDEIKTSDYGKYLLRILKDDLP